MPRPGVLGIRQLDFTFPIPSCDIIANETGSLLRSADWQTAWFEWRVFGGDRQNGDHFEINYQRLMDAPSGTFEIFRGVVIQPGRYWRSRYELQYFMNPGRPVSVGAFVNWGQFYGGHTTGFARTVGRSARRASPILPRFPEKPPLPSPPASSRRRCAGPKRSVT